MTINTARLRALAEAATLGARSVEGSRILVGDALGSQTWGPNWRNDQAFIAAADPATVLALLDEIESLRDQVDSMQMANDMLRATHRTDNQYLLDEIDRLRGAIREALDFEAALPAIATVPHKILTDALEAEGGETND